MDKYGRKHAGLPAYLMLSVGLAAVPSVASLPGLIGVSIVMGLGNGCSAGLNVTLGMVACGFAVLDRSTPGLRPFQCRLLPGLVFFFPGQGNPRRSIS